MATSFTKSGDRSSQLTSSCREIHRSTGQLQLQSVPRSHWHHVCGSFCSCPQAKGKRKGKLMSVPGEHSDERKMERERKKERERENGGKEEEKEEGKAFSHA